jgi:hypothetical protein
VITPHRTSLLLEMAMTARKFPTSRLAKRGPVSARSSKAEQGLWFECILVGRSTYKLLITKSYCLPVLKIGERGFVSKNRSSRKPRIAATHTSPKWDSGISNKL